MLLCDLGDRLKATFVGTANYVTRLRAVLENLVTFIYDFILLGAAEIAIPTCRAITEGEPWGTYT